MFQDKQELSQLDELFLAEQGMQALEESMWRRYEADITEKDAEIDLMSLDDDEYEEAMEQLLDEDAKNGTIVASEFWQTELRALQALFSKEELDQFCKKGEER